MLIRGLRRVLAGLVLAALLASGVELAAAPRPSSDLKILIPGGLGGGWDYSARTMGRLLQQQDLLDRVHYRYLPADGGAAAVTEMMKSDQDGLLLASTPIIIRSLRQQYTVSFRRLQAVASVFGDPALLLVAESSPWHSLADMVAAWRLDPQAFLAGGGYPLGGLSHIALVALLSEAAVAPAALRYQQYPQADQAVAALLSGELQVLSTNLGEWPQFAERGTLRPLCVASSHSYTDIAACKLAGEILEFVNWRGFFASSDMSSENLALWQGIFADMVQQPAWLTLQREHNWQPLHRSGADFVQLLEEQERHIRFLLEALGF